MRPGSLNSKILFILISFYFSPLNAETQVDLQNIQPTFEEELETIDDKKTEQFNYIKSGNECTKIWDYENRNGKKHLELLETNS